MGWGVSVLHVVSHPGVNRLTGQHHFMRMKVGTVMFFKAQPLELPVSFPPHSVDYKDCPDSRGWGQRLHLLMRGEVTSHCREGLDH